MYTCICVFFLHADVMTSFPFFSFLLLLLEGVGKTTMAHIIAKHTGYRAVEVNASDERTAAVLKQHVLRAMESGLSEVPNCIILDEIDGADAQTTISTLVEIIKEDHHIYMQSEICCCSTSITFLRATI
jgi:replication-associated recombination protein RarA